MGQKRQVTIPHANIAHVELIKKERRVMANGVFARYDRYLVDSINRIHESLDKAVVYAGQVSYVMEAAGAACGALQRLYDDPEFRTNVQQIYLSASKPANLELEEFTDDFEEFLRLEREILVKGGVAATARELLISQCRSESVLSSMRQLTGSADQVMNDIGSLRDKACNMADQLSQQYQKDEDRKRWRKRMRIIGLGIGGAVLIGTNFGGLAVTVGISTAASTVSGGAGVGMITTAAGLLVEW